MFLDLLLSYLLVGAFMGLCIWRHERKGPMPIQTSHEWAGLIAACLIWPMVWWNDGAEI